MKIISIQNKDIYVTLEIGLHDIEKIIKALDHAEINYDHKDVSIDESAKYLINEFYPAIKEVVDDLVEN